MINTLGMHVTNKSRNLDFMKFMAAMLVIREHSFTICGFKHNNFLENVVSATVSTGEMAVCFFMFVSGMMLSKSLLMCASEGGISYLSEKDFLDYIRHLHL